MPEIEEAPVDSPTEDALTQFITFAAEAVVTHSEESK